jgi:formylglycine-generating enzyme required for sulfatase activity
MDARKASIWVVLIVGAILLEAGACVGKAPGTDVSDGFDGTDVQEGVAFDVTDAGDSVDLEIAPVDIGDLGEFPTDTSWDAEDPMVDNGRDSTDAEAEPGDTPQEASRDLEGSDIDDRDSDDGGPRDLADPGPSDVAGDADVNVAPCGSEGSCGPHLDCIDDRCVTPMDVVPRTGPVFMGSNSYHYPCPELPYDPDAPLEETPCILVSIPTFRIERYEVTVEQYRACVSAGGCTPPFGMNYYCNWSPVPYPFRAQRPVNCVNWRQARDYCAWAGRRLCSESEWEKAARGSDARIYPWGNDTPTCEHAVMLGNDRTDEHCTSGMALPVGSKPAGRGPYGTYDLMGNVSEWVQDIYIDNLEAVPTDGSPFEYDHVATPMRVARGGNFLFWSRSIRSAAREHYMEDESHSDYGILGIRCCQSGSTLDGT